MTTQTIFKCFEDVQQYLDTFGVFRMHMSLDNITRVLKNMDLLRPSFFVTQVIGTNGKGSTSSMISSISQSAGYKTGLFCSPHFISPRERIKIDGELISEESWVSHGNKILEHGGEILSYFEFTTVLAVSIFEEQNIDLCVLEAGLGGTWDSTSAIAADLLVITPIAMDHENVLGNNILAIAKDKAGAIKSSSTVCSAPQRKEVEKILDSKTKKHQASLFFSKNIYLPQSLEDGSTSMYLQGEFQKSNAKLAILAWQKIQEIINTPVKTNRTTEEIITIGLQHAWIPGRMQYIPPTTSSTKGISGELFMPCPSGWPPFILDGAHNAHAMATLSENFAKQKIAPLAVIFSCLADKKPELLIPHLRILTAGPIFIPPIPNNPRSIPQQELAKMIGIQAVAVNSLKEAICLASEHMEQRMPEIFNQQRTCNPLLICGSLYLLGLWYELRPECLNIPRS